MEAIKISFAEIHLLPRNSTNQAQAGSVGGRVTIPTANLWLQVWAYYGVEHGTEQNGNDTEKYVLTSVLALLPTPERTRTHTRTHYRPHQSFCSPGGRQAKSNKRILGLLASGPRP